MRIGLDLDNTIICYDDLFHRLATARGLLDAPVGITKREVKAWIVGQHGNEAWTELQGEVYGNALRSASPYPGALEFVCRCRAAGHGVGIISHKTRFPALGQRVDLRSAALEWLDAQGWFKAGALERTDVEFYDSRPEKVAAIADRACDIFVDDLPEVFGDPGFPDGVCRILFDPNETLADSKLYLRTRNWTEIFQSIFPP